MARGRGGSNDFGVVTRRRYMSVDPELELDAASRRTQRLADYMNEDAASLSHHSRTKDRDLLNDITQRLGQNTNYPPYCNNHPHHYYQEVARKLPESPLFIIAGSRRGGSVPPPRPKIDIYEEERKRPRVFMTPPPPPRRLSPSSTPLPPNRKKATIHYKSYPRPPAYRARRAASEPPPYRAPVYASVPLRRPYVSKEVPYYSSAEPYRYYTSGAPYYSRANPIHAPYFRGGYYRAPSYYDYRYRMPQYDYDDYSIYYDDYEPHIYRANYRTTPYAAPSHHASVRNARRHLESLERELGLQNGPVIDEPVIIHHVHAGPTARVVGSSRAPRASYRVVTVPPADGSFIRHRSSSLPPVASPRAGISHNVPRRSRIADIEARLELDNYSYPEVKPESLSSLRSRTSAARDKMDAHKVMMDRYLPIHLGPENEVEWEVDYKYGELVNRMPTLDRHRPHQGNISVASIPPYKPASTHKPPSGANYGPAPRANFRPKVSDTRRRIRDVLCATKNDPHYYD